MKPKRIPPDRSLLALRCTTAALLPAKAQLRAFDEVPSREHAP